MLWDLTQLQPVVVVECPGFQVHGPPGPQISIAVLLLRFTRVPGHERRRPVAGIGQHCTKNKGKNLATMDHFHDEIRFK
jgi:hypothetical protein